jgi:hypothetical protein
MDENEKWLWLRADEARLRRKHLKLDLIYGAIALALFGFMALAFFIND